MTWDITPARDSSPRVAGSLVVAGPPGTGKSWFLGTMAKLGPTLLIATLPREVKSYQYQLHNIDHVLLYDKEWLPSANRFDATGFRDFLDLMEALLDDKEYRNIIIDNGTELGEICWHAALKTHSVASPGEMVDKKNRWLPYDQINDYMDQAVKSATALTNPGAAVLPKNVGFTWHVQPPKDDTTETVEVAPNVKVQKTKESGDHVGQGVEYEGNMLPSIRGRFRRKLVSLVDAFVFTELVPEVVKDGNRARKELRYKIQVRPTEDRHVKLPGPLPAHMHIDNDFEQFLPLLGVAPKAEKRNKKGGRK